MSTLGKTITLQRGEVVTDIGAAIVNGQRDGSVRVVRADDGRTSLLLARVMDETPETIRRGSFGWRP